MANIEIFLTTPDLTERRFLSELTSQDSARMSGGVAKLFILYVTWSLCAVVATGKVCLFSVVCFQSFHRNILYSMVSIIWDPFFHDRSNTCDPSNM